MATLNAEIKLPLFCFGQNGQETAFIYLCYSCINTYYNTWIFWPPRLELTKLKLQLWHIIWYITLEICYGDSIQLPIHMPSRNRATLAFILSSPDESKSNSNWALLQSSPAPEGNIWLCSCCIVSLFSPLVANFFYQRFLSAGNEADERGEKSIRT